MKILIVGLGSISKKHIEAIRLIDSSADLFALRHSKFSKEVLGIKSIYSWEDVDFIPDFILISNPTSEHADSIRKALTYKCPLFIEKPALHNLLEAQQLLDIIKETKTITYIGCDLRFHPALNFLKSYILKNNFSVNEVNIYCGSYLPNWRKGVDYKKNYSAIPELGGGVHFDLIHELDYCYWIFGKPIASNKFFSSKSNLRIKAYDYANYIFEYPSFNASIILNYYRNDTKRYIEVVTDISTIKLDIITGDVIDADGIALFQSAASSEEIYLNQMRHFFDCVLSKKESINPFYESIEVLKLCIE